MSRKHEYKYTPKVENKYNLKPKDIERATVIDRDKLHQPPFWRNNVVDAWCLSGGVGKGYPDGFCSSYWIGFYDDTAKAWAGRIRLSCDCMDEMCKYNFTKFYDPEEIDDKWDWLLQEKLLGVLNWLLEEKIVSIPGIVIEST